jgi:hypothetical protein
MASLRLTVVGLFLLMVLTIWGTLYQVDYGLYQAQHRFFQSWYFLAGGFFPFPGAQLVMAVLFANLLAAVVLLAIRGRMRMGLLLTHGGLLLMLAAGAVTFYLGDESHLTLFEGEGANVSQSYNAWELAVSSEASASGREITAVDARALPVGAGISFPTGAFEIQAEDYLPNSSASRRGAAGDGESQEYQNGAGVAEVSPLPRSKEPGQELPALKLVVMRQGREHARLLLWGGDRAPTRVTVGDEVYAFELRRRRTPLPATIQLADFRKELHPGSGIARSYSSQVVVRPEQGPERKVLISMNKPLRLQNFTFYQSSYNTLPDGREASTLAVVKNYGRTMPYIATGVTVLGMTLHFLGRLALRARRVARRETPT